MSRIGSAGVGALAAIIAAAAFAQQHDASMHQHGSMTKEEPAMQQRPTTLSTDGRIIVHFPQDLRDHTLANMRDHLLALQQIEEALAVQDFDKAGDIAERRLGMSAMALHGAHDVAPYMPQGMREVGSAMHRSASQFARAAEEASATGDMKPAMAALSRVMANCVGCHAGYRVQ
jgi:hypothetical protein